MSTRKFVVGFYALLLLACDPTALQINSAIASAANSVAEQANTAVRHYRTDVELQAARAVHDAGGTQEVAQAAAVARAQQNDVVQLLAAQRAYSAGVRAFAATVLAAATAGGVLDEQGHLVPVTLTTFVDDIQAFLGLYRAMRDVGTSFHIDWISALPELPSWLAPLTSSLTPAGATP